MYCSYKELYIASQDFCCVHGPMALGFLLLLNVLAVAAKCHSPWWDCGSTDMKVTGCY